MSNSINITAVYVAGAIITAGLLFGGGARINNSGEAIAMAAFCLLWPLTWAYVIAMTAFLFVFCGWRGGPIW